MAGDALTILQGQLKQQGLHMTRPQFTNILYGTVLQTDVSIAPLLPVGASSPIPTGMMTVAVAAMGSNYVTNPVLYPGGVAPAVGTTVAMGFSPNGTPICVALYGFSGVSGTVTLAKLETLGTNGSLTFENGIITAFTAPT